MQLFHLPNRRADSHSPFSPVPEAGGSCVSKIVLILQHYFKTHLDQDWAGLCQYCSVMRRCKGNDGWFPGWKFQACPLHCGKSSHPLLYEHVLEWCFYLLDTPSNQLPLPPLFLLDVYQPVAHQMAAKTIFCLLVAYKWLSRFVQSSYCIVRR